MSTVFNPIIFYPAAILIILFSILTIVLKNIFYSLISAIVVFFLAGYLFFVLGSEYNAVIQVAIYGIAVPIIIGLAVMFTDIKFKKQNIKNNNLRYILFLTSGVFILSMIYLVMTSTILTPYNFTNPEIVINNSHQVLNAFSRGFFIDYIWAFELVALILTMIIVGLTLFDNKKEDE